MKYILTFLFCTIQFGYSQTKLIAHKSHSGTNSTFSKAIEKHSILRSSDFGKIMPQRIKIDTLKYISNKLLISVYKNKIDSTQMFNLKDNDLASIMRQLRQFRYNTVILENFEIKDTIAYYKEKYGYFFPRKKVKLNLVKRIPENKIILITGEKSDTLNGEIKELREIEWFASKYYDTTNTTFTGFTKSKKERFTTMNYHHLYDFKHKWFSIYSNRLEKAKKTETKKNTINSTEQQPNYKRDSTNILSKDELHKKNSEDVEETIPVFKVNNHQPPFDNKIIYIALIGLILIGMIYKVLQPKTI